MFLNFWEIEDALTLERGEEEGVGDLSVGNPGNNEGRSSGSISPTRHLHHCYCGNQTLRPSRVALDIGGRLMGVSRLSHWTQDFWSLFWGSVIDSVTTDARVMWSSVLAWGEQKGGARWSLRRVGGDVTRDLVLLRGSRGRSSAITRVCVSGWFLFVTNHDKPWHNHQLSLTYKRFNEFKLSPRLMLRS